MSGTSGNEEEMAEEAEGEAGGGLRRGGCAQLSQLCCTVAAEALCTASPGLQKSALAGGSRLSPQSHTEVTVSHSTRRLWPFGCL